MIGAEAPQGIVEQPQGAVARALVSLRRQEHLISRRRARGTEGSAVVVLALLIGGRGVAVGDAQAQRLEYHRHRLRGPPAGAQDPLAAQRDRQHARAGPPQRARRGGRRRRRRCRRGHRDRHVRSMGSIQSCAVRASSQPSLFRKPSGSKSLVGHVRLSIAVSEATRPVPADLRCRHDNWHIESATFPQGAAPEEGHASDLATDLASDLADLRRHRRWPRAHGQ